MIIIPCTFSNFHGQSHYSFEVVKVGLRLIVTCAEFIMGAWCMLTTFCNCYHLLCA